MSGTPKHKEIVLDTIDQLRKRKARPDFERICHMLYRRHGLSKAEVQEELDLLVDAEAVIKVDYKGNTSYRNAAKWVRFNKSLSSDTGAAAAAAATAVAVGCGGPQATTFKVSRAIGDAVRDLWFAGRKHGTAVDAGVSAAELDAYLQSRDFKCTKGALELGIDKELASGRLVRLPSGRFAPSEAEKQRAAKLAASPPKAPPRVVKPLLQQSCEGVPSIGGAATCSAPANSASNGTNGVRRRACTNFADGQAVDRINGTALLPTERQASQAPQQAQGQGRRRGGVRGSQDPHIDRKREMHSAPWRGVEQKTKRRSPQARHGPV
nr:atherin-like [Rhipicephalus microplus]